MFNLILRRAATKPAGDGCNGRGQMTRFAAIRDEMLRRINDGDWPVGHELPTEPQLAQEFGVARGTIRRAMDALSDQGLILRRKRAGTRVAARQGHASRMTIPIVRLGIEARGER